MSVILIFVVFVLIGDTAAVFVSSLFERVSNFTSLLVFLTLFILVFGVAWKLAVLVTERFLVRQNLSTGLTASKVMLMPVAWLEPRDLVDSCSDCPQLQGGEP